MTYREKLKTHINDYFDYIDTSSVPNELSLNVVIPYYNSKETINLLLTNLLSELKSVQDFVSNFIISIVDDGSLVAPANESVTREWQDLVRIIKLDHNAGRAKARNIGLLSTDQKYTLFVDSDIILAKGILRNTLLRMHSVNSKNKSAIVCGLFDFISYKDYLRGTIPSKITDFRIKCDYIESYIGCENDRRFINKSFELMKDTNCFSKWDYKVGPWYLTNMVLGGLFCVNTAEAKHVGGCDEIFNDWGYEETSLATKLICNLDSYIIPIQHPRSFHIDHLSSALSWGEKSHFFKKGHSLYEAFLDSSL